MRKLVSPAHPCFASIIKTNAMATLEKAKEYVKYLSETYAQPIPVYDEHIAAAKREAKRMVYSTEDLFLRLAALNLLNRAIKIKPNNFGLSYGFIKGNAGLLLTWLVRVKSSTINYRLFVDTTESCAYVEVEGVLFSFHHVHLDDSLRHYSKEARNEPITWEGIRLQPIALPLFQWACDISYNRLGSEQEI